MTHGRKKRTPRAVHQNALQMVLCRATRLTAAEVRSTIAPAKASLDKLRQGMASEDQHTVLVTCLLIAMGIEDSGIVRGLRGHIAQALAAMAAIRARALTSGTWRCTALHFHELDDLRAAVELHEFQLRQVSAGELCAVAKKIEARTRSGGGIVVRTSAQDLGLEAA